MSPSLAGRARLLAARRAIAATLAIAGTVAGCGALTHHARARDADGLPRPDGAVQRGRRAGPRLGLRRRRVRQPGPHPGLDQLHGERPRPGHAREGLPLHLPRPRGLRSAPRPDRAMRGEPSSPTPRRTRRSSSHRTSCRARDRGRRGSRRPCGRCWRRPREPGADPGAVARSRAGTGRIRTGPHRNRPVPGRPSRSARDHRAVERSNMPADAPAHGAHTAPPTRPLDIPGLRPR